MQKGQTGSRINRHLNEVDETYFEHLQHALSFALAMLWGAACCVVHAFLPFLCEKSGSRIISHLHGRMVVNRKGLGKTARSAGDNTGNQAGASTEGGSAQCV
ncbi:MAG: hypothetical protein PsegKO_17080 [Pseudohongiellaceae bacterium]|jgi:hypothetical protein